MLFKVFSVVILQKGTSCYKSLPVFLVFFPRKLSYKCNFPGQSLIHSVILHFLEAFEAFDVYCQISSRKVTSLYFYPQDKKWALLLPTMLPTLSIISIRNI